MAINTKLYTDVVEKLNFEPFLDTSHITVGVTDDGLVTLNGTVKSYAKKIAAESAVKKVKGVHGVANDLDVEIIEPDKRSDTDIAATAIEILKWNLLVPHDHIKVLVDNGWITLSGDVEYGFQKKAAELHLQHLSDVKGLTNLIAVKPKATSHEVKEQIEKEFHRLAILDASHITVDTHDSKVTLKGEVSSWPEYEEAEAAAWSVAGITEVDNRLKVH